MNLAISCTENCAGLFGAVTEKNTTIKNVIMDASCSISSTASAVGGLVGGLIPTDGDENRCNVIIQDCGNEASVTGAGDTGGIVGGVYAEDTSVLKITNCYNTGVVKSTGNKAAAICGYARKNYTITGCYNSGTVSGVESSDKCFYRYKEGGATSVTNCYDVNGKQTGVSQVTAEQLKSGEICFLLNDNKANGTWGQSYFNASPVLSSKGMQHYSRTMANQWGTICLPFDVRVNGDDADDDDPDNDYDFYQLSGVSGDALTLTKIKGTVAAGTPVIVRRSGSATGIDVSAVSGTTFADTPAIGSSADGLTITGAFSTTEITDKDGYIISNNAFWNISDIKGEDKVYCSPFHAYLAGTVENNARCLTISADETTGIDLTPALSRGEGELNGKFIVNGQLVIIRNGKEYDAAGHEVK